jgi:uncharacterized Zn-binding protein involved in type VI secretion
MDVGISAPCCGPNLWMTDAGSTTVTVDGAPLVRMGDMVKHCGSFPGTVTTGSFTVIVGG